MDPFHFKDERAGDSTNYAHKVNLVWTLKIDFLNRGYDINYTRPPPLGSNFNMHLLDYMIK